MRKKVFQMGNILLLSALLAAPAVADSFKSDIFCRFPEGRGQVKIEGKGNVHISMSGLAPNTTYVCDVECELFGEAFLHDCTSDDHGEIDATFKKAVDICIGPVVEIEAEVGGEEEVICATGFISSELL
jgi:hypothetical protein